MINYGNGLTWEGRQAINQINEDKHRGTLCPGTEHGWQFEDDIFKIILKYDSCCTLILNSRRFVSMCPINNKPALRQKMVCITLVSQWAPWLLESPVYRLFDHLFKRIPKKSSKLRVTGLCERNTPITNGLHSQKASYAENVRGIHQLLTYICVPKPQMVKACHDLYQHSTFMLMFISHTYEIPKQISCVPKSCTE